MEQADIAAAFARARADVPPYPEGRFGGRGIVICAGGARLFTCAWVCIGMLRRVLGCTLPIEVWHLGPAEMSPTMRALLEEMDAQVIDAHAVAAEQGARTLGGWELKPYAMLHSRFQEVLLLDADNVPIVDPAFLFETEEYRQEGTVFWPDVVRIRRDSPIWTLCGVAFRDMPSVESGQLLLDKRRAWAGLTLACWMNQHSDRFYDVLYGDKDTYLLAWLAQGIGFAMVPRPPRMLPDTFCQRGFDGTVIFQHRNGAKWILRGSNPRIEGFAREDACFDLLGELDRLWDGRIFHPPARSARARQAEADIAMRGCYRLERVSVDAHDLELRSAHRIAPRQGIAGGYWHVEDQAAGLVLVFTTEGRVTCRLEPAADGSWHGTLLEPPHCPVSLVARSGDATVMADAEDAMLRAMLDAIATRHAALPASPDLARDLVGMLRCLMRVYGSRAHAVALRLATERPYSPFAVALASLPASGPAAVPEHSGHGSAQATNAVLLKHYER